ncbi:hypothetical protein [Actinoplanes sp. G11-F43]|uniref:hypothetical protein n=1 Tax=Actinoplanes sp. G11-F43 TaxID=3424130 RepID=UPI003D326A47
MSIHGELRNTVAVLAEPRRRPPGPGAVVAARVVTLVGAAGIVPVHVAWAAGAPVLADAGRFAAWHAGGGRVLPATVALLALCPVVLSLVLVSRRGRAAELAVPRLPLIVPGYLLLAGFTGYALLIALFPAIWPEVFSPWAGVYGLVTFAVWLPAFAMTVHSHDVRTRHGIR